MGFGWRPTLEMIQEHAEGKAKVAEMENLEPLLVPWFKEIWKYHLGGEHGNGNLIDTLEILIDERGTVDRKEYREVQSKATGKLRF